MHHKEKGELVKGSFSYCYNDTREILNLKKLILRFISEKESVPHNLIENYFELVNITLNNAKVESFLAEEARVREKRIQKYVSKVWKRFLIQEKGYDFSEDREVWIPEFDPSLEDDFEVDEYYPNPFSYDSSERLVNKKMIEYTYTFRKMVEYSFRDLFLKNSSRTFGIIISNDFEKEKEFLIKHFYGSFYSATAFLYKNNTLKYFNKGKREYKLGSLAGFCASLVLGFSITGKDNPTLEDLHEKSRYAIRKWNKEV